MSDKKIPNVNHAAHGPLRFFSVKNTNIRLLLGELMGTFLLMTLGNASVAQLVLGQGKYGKLASVNIGYGIGVAVGILACGGISGGHLNPAVSLTLALLGKTPWKQLPFLMIGQYLGSFISCPVVYFTYLDALNKFDGGNRSVIGPLATANIFSTYPTGEFISTTTTFFDQILGTALLLFCVMAITDERNMSVPKHVQPICVMMLVTIIGMSFCWNCGYAINPARDLSPRLFTLIAGWGHETFSYRNYNYFWVPIVGPHLGAIVGAYTYQLTIGYHFPPEIEEADPNPVKSIARRSTISQEKNTKDPGSECSSLGSHFDLRIQHEGTDL